MLRDLRDLAGWQTELVGKGLAMNRVCTYTELAGRYPESCPLSLSAAAFVCSGGTRWNEQGCLCVSRNGGTFSPHRDIPIKVDNE